MPTIAIQGSITEHSEIIDPFFFFPLGAKHKLQKLSVAV